MYSIWFYSKIKKFFSLQWFSFYNEMTSQRVPGESTGTRIPTSISPSCTHTGGTCTLGVTVGTVILTNVSPFPWPVYNWVLSLCGVSLPSVYTCYETPRETNFPGSPTTGVTSVYYGPMCTYRPITGGGDDTCTGRVTPSIDSSCRTRPVVPVSSVPPTTSVVSFCRPSPLPTLSPSTVFCLRFYVGDSSVSREGSTTVTSPLPLYTVV